MRWNALIEKSNQFNRQCNTLTHAAPVNYIAKQEFPGEIIDISLTPENPNFHDGWITGRCLLQNASLQGMVSV